MKTKLKKCACCGEPISGRKKFYCSVECQKKCYARHKNEENGTGYDIKRNCQWCGKEITKYGRTKFCSDECSRASRYLKVKKDKVNPLEDIVKKATAEGLTYGQYCVKHGLY